MAETNEMTMEEYLAELDSRKIDNVETAALTRDEAQEVRRTFNRVFDRAERTLRAYNAGRYGAVDLSFEVDETKEYPDMDQIRADYARWGETVPMKPGKPSIVINYVN